MIVPMQIVTATMAPCYRTGPVPLFQCRSVVAQFQWRLLASHAGHHCVACIEFEYFWIVNVGMFLDKVFEVVVLHVDK
jgi:hypothetical protein